MSAEQPLAANSSNRTVYRHSAGEAEGSGAVASAARGGSLRRARFMTPLRTAGEKDTSGERRR